MGGRVELIHKLLIDGLRALSMKSAVELKPLNVVVGRNGIGKSTLLRLFPLLRQSSERETRDPILWWHDDFVDFGSFSDAVQHNRSDMTFEFTVRPMGAARRGYGRLGGLQDTDRDGDAEQFVSITLAGDADRCWTSRVKYAISDRSWVQFDAVADCSADRFGWGSVSGSLDGVAFQFNDLSSASWQSALSGSGSSLVYFDGPNDYSLLGNELGDIFHGKTEPWNIFSILRRCGWKSDDAFIGGLDSSRLTAAKFKVATAELRANPIRLRRLRELRLVLDILEHVAVFGANLTRFARGVSYLGPERATPRRGYRAYNAPVDRLDSRGANLAEFLESLRKEEQVEFDKFLKDAIGVTVSSKKVGDQLQVRINLEGHDYNLADVGFGYSQVLPVLAEIWGTARSVRQQRASQLETSIIVVEQPELHLHPHQQALLARAICRLAAPKPNRTTPPCPPILIETHSDHMIFEFGKEVVRGTIAPSELALLCVESDGRGGATVRSAAFDSEGFLVNWPRGFLSPEVRR